MPLVRNSLKSRALQQLPGLGELPLDVLRGAPKPENRNPTAVDEISEDLNGPGGDLPLRIYRSGARGDLPLLLFMHGGGFVLGDLDTHDEFARAVTAGCGCITVPWPTGGPGESLPGRGGRLLRRPAVGRRKRRGPGCRPGRIVVIGDSAGANLAAVTALRARDEQGPAIAGQVLVYPTADLGAPMRPAPDGGFYISAPKPANLQRVLPQRPRPVSCPRCRRCRRRAWRTARAL